MNGTGKSIDDPIGAAIAATEEKPQVELKQIKVDLEPAGKRFLVLAVPTDLTPVELIGFIGYLTAGGLSKNLAESAGPPRPQLVIASRLPT